MSGDTIGKTSKDEPATDWRRLHEMTDEESAAAIKDDDDLRPLDEKFWKTARLVGKPSRVARSAMRFDRAVTRICIEACWIQRYEIAIDALKTEDAVGTDFFRVAFIALQDGRLIRLIRLLEDSPRTVSFWYLHRVERQLVDSAAEQVGFDLGELRRISEKLRSVRNGAFVHVDKNEIFNPQRLYQDMNIPLQELAMVSLNLFKVMKEIYRIRFAKIFEYDDYDGSDIPLLARLRDTAEVEGLEKKAVLHKGKH